MKQYSSTNIKVFFIGLIVGIVIYPILITLSQFSTIIKDTEAIHDSSGIAVATKEHAPHKEITLIAENATVELQSYHPRVGVWTFNGTVPGPTLRFTEGDNVTIHLINKSPMSHTLHLHGDHGALADGLFELAIPNKSYTYNFIAAPAGAFPYHCHAMPTSLHMRMGMYGMMIIDPKVPLPPAREYGIVMGEYSNVTNYEKPGVIQAQYYLNNGYFDQYMGNNYLPVRQNELVRLYVVNDGAGLVYPLHIHGQIFKAYPSGLLSNTPEDRQTVLIGDGDAAIIEIRWPYPGSYLFHVHGIEEDNGDMGCFYVIPSTNIAGEATAPPCSVYVPNSEVPGPSHTETVPVPALTPVTTKSISMIDWQYQLQKKLQKPIVVTSNPS